MPDTIGPILLVAAACLFHGAALLPVNKGSITDHRRFLLEITDETVCLGCYACTCGSNDCREVGQYFCYSFNIDCDENAPSGELKWSYWSPWDTCSASCGVGVQRRKRHCTTQDPINCECMGSEYETQECKRCDNTGLLINSTFTKHETKPTARTTTETKAPVTTTVTIGTTVTTRHPSLPCNKLCTATAVADAKNYENLDARMCPNGKREGSEAIPLRCCPLANIPDNWQPGENVLRHCGTIHPYMAAAIFLQGKYVPGSAGVFLGCLTDGNIGFKFIRQDCGSVPELQHLSLNTSVTSNIENYFVIV